MKKLYMFSVLFLSVSACKQRKPDRGALPTEPTCNQDLLLATTPNVLDVNRIGFGLSGVDRSEGLALLSVPVGKQNLPEEVQSFVRDGVLVLAMGVRDLNVREEVAFNLADKAVKNVKKPLNSGSKVDSGSPRVDQNPSRLETRSGGEDSGVNSKIEQNGSVLEKDGDVNKKEGETKGSAVNGKKNFASKFKDGVKTKWAAVKKWSDDHPKFAKMGKWGVGVTGLALLFHVITQEDDVDTIYVFGDDLPKELTSDQVSSDENVVENESSDSGQSPNSSESSNTAPNSSDAQKEGTFSSADQSESEPNIVTLDVGKEDDATAYVVDTDKGEISNITVGVQGEHDALQDPTLSQTCGVK